MPTILVARELIVTGTVSGSVLGDFFYTQGFPAGGLSTVSVLATALAFAPSGGTIRAYIQRSGSKDAWEWVLSSTPALVSLMTFTGVDSQTVTVAPSAPPPYNAATGGAWLRLALRVEVGSGVFGSFRIVSAIA